MGTLLSGVPDVPVGEWPEGLQPQLVVSREAKWVSLSADINALVERLQILDAMPVPSVELAAPAVDAELLRNQDQVFELEMTVASVTQQIQAEQSQIRSIDKRLAALRESGQKQGCCVAREARRHR